VQGSVVVGANTRIGYLDQARSELEDDAMLREAALGDATEVALGEERLSAGAYLERFLFDRRQQRLRVSELSGGERARVCLARLLAQKCNLLLLDEPTNDLDVATLGALESMLLDFGGSVILVSHDRWLLDRISTSTLVFEGEGRVEQHAGGYSEYVARRGPRSRSGGAAPRASVTEPAPAKGGMPAVGEARRSPKDAGGLKLSQAERRELEGLMEKIEGAEVRVGEIQAQLADPATYQSEGDEVVRLKSELEMAEAEALRLTERWELLETRDAASKQT